MRPYAKMPRGVKHVPAEYNFDMSYEQIAALKGRAGKLYHLITTRRDVTRFMVGCKCENPKKANSAHYHFLYSPGEEERRAIEGRNIARWNRRNNQDALPFAAHSGGEKRIVLKSMMHLVNMIHYLRCPRSQGECRHSGFLIKAAVRGRIPLCRGKGHHKADCKDYRRQLAEHMNIPFVVKDVTVAKKKTAAWRRAQK